MSFATDLTEYSAADIIAAIGCPRGTAYDWKDGRREPPSWQQVHWLAIIARSSKKKHNKPAHTIPPRRVAKRKGS